MNKKIKKVLFLLIFFLILQAIFMLHIYAKDSDKIDADLINIKIGNNSSGNYISGEVKITQTNNEETINFKTLPKIFMQTKEGQKKQAVVTLKKSNIYSFTIYTDGLVVGTTANIKVEISGIKQDIQTSSNNFLGCTTYGKPISYSSKDGNMVLQLGGTYEGDINTEIKSIAISSNSKGNYIYGIIDIAEQIDGKTYHLNTLPTLTLKLDNEKSKKAILKLVGANTYSYEIYTDGLVTGIDSKLIAQTSNQFNVSKNKSEYIQTINTKFLGVSTYGRPISYSNKSGDMIIHLGGNYEGDINTEIKSMAISKNSNGNYIYGTLDISETIKGRMYSPTTLPTLTLKLDNGKSKKATLKLVSGNTYSYEIYTDGLVTGINGNLFAELTSQFNTSKNKGNTIKANSSKFLGITSYGKPISYSNSKGELILKLGGSYEGIISAELIQKSIQITSGGNFLFGEITGYETVSGIKVNMLYAPKITLVSSSGIKKSATVTQKSGNIYSFKVSVDSISNSDTCYLELSQTNPANTSTKSFKLNLDLNNLWGEYGKSYLGETLKYKKLGTGPNILFVVATQHGFEDAWGSDGRELTIIANNLINELTKSEYYSLLQKWTIYIVPEANPDGSKKGYTNNGFGRCTYQGYDMNRIYPTSNFQVYTSSRNYTGNRPLLAVEAEHLTKLMLSVKSRSTGKIVVVDLHGWLNETLGDNSVGKFYNAQFGNSNRTSWGAGYLVTWAKEKLGAQASLVELPMPKTPKDIINRDFSGKFIRGTINLLKGL